MCARRTRLKAVLWLEFTYISLSSGRPVNHPDDLMQLFRAVLIDDCPTDFDARAETLRAQFRRRAEPAAAAA